MKNKVTFSKKKKQIYNNGVWYGDKDFNEL